MTNPMFRSVARPARALAVPLLALALAGCASSRGLQPQGRLLDADRLQASGTFSQVRLTPAAWPDSQWWRTLGDARLDALVEEALQGTPSLEAADARLRQAQAQAGSANAQRGPEVSATAGYTGLRLPESMVGDELGGSYAGSGHAALSFSYGLDLWGGKRAAWEAAVDQAHAAQVDAQAARLDLSAGIVQAYVQLDYAWRLHDVASEELERSRRLLELTRQRRAAGIDSDVQLRQAEARVPAAQQQQQAAQQSIDEARTALAALLGQGPDRGLAIARPQLAPDTSVALPSVLPSDLLGRRPDVVAARWRVEAAGKGIAAAKAQFYPSLNLTAMAGVASKDVGDLLKSGSTFAYLGPALSLPIFDSGRLRSGLAERDAQYDLAVAGYNQAVVQALREVADQVNALQSLQGQLASQAQALETAGAAFDLAQQRYRAGIGSYVEALTVQQQVLATRQRMAALQSERLQAAARLSRALGGGLAPVDAAQASFPQETPHS
ncbi:efflux transporter outer membrane subunit [Stenotrophomonas sp. MMGLT7]|uniref:efflux transporter outer membrane subunit n=1 Tax=Stenotrophomonas sp. MMGLT7 TaxID=2901227 RepID=UPI001E63C499|nr:efflux transporter outer membrane subunit [Stenotrophomonas sp. MMGLT7]MCD7098978.1 efflux transporter outer membrane subunit [Stenotrophomonas sp. MMGLT7]